MIVDQNYLDLARDAAWQMFGPKIEHQPYRTESIADVAQEMEFIFQRFHIDKVVAGGACSASVGRRVSSLEDS